MYKVYCRGRKNSKWRSYSKEFNALQDAKNCKNIAKNRKTCDVYGNLIMYKIISK